MKSMSSSTTGLSKNKGYTLIEMLVVLAIFIVITSVVVFNYGKFSSNLIVTNLAYEAALAVREAQISGIAVKGADVVGETQQKFNFPYGVWFDKTEDQSFTVFADTADSDNKYTRISDFKSTGYEFAGTNRILKFCVGGDCSDVVANGIQSVSVIFVRPDPDAHFYLFDTNGGVIAPKPGNLEVYFTSGRGDKIAALVVTPTGQISVTSCSNTDNNLLSC